MGSCSNCRNLMVKHGEDDEQYCSLGEGQTDNVLPDDLDKENNCPDFRWEAFL